MEEILQYIAEACSGVQEIDITACSSEAAVRAVAIRARAVCGVHSALDLYAHLKALQEGAVRCPFSKIHSLLGASHPLLVLDLEFHVDKNALFRSAASGSLFDVALLLTVSFDVHFGEEDYDYYYGLYEGGAPDIDILPNARTFDVNDKDAQGNTPLLLACRAGNLELAEMLVLLGANVLAENNTGDTSLFLACRAGKLELAKMLVGAGADVNAANDRDDTPLLAAFGAGNVELAEMLVSKGANVKAEAYAVREDGAGLLSLAIVSQDAGLLNFARTRGPQRLAHQETMSVCEFDKALAEAYAKAYFEPEMIEAWLRDADRYFVRRYQGGENDSQIFQSHYRILLCSRWLYEVSS
jgi:ankyrin repeat protein